jgi:hypothetical protein
VADHQETGCIMKPVFKKLEDLGSVVTSCYRRTTPKKLKTLEFSTFIFPCPGAGLLIVFIKVFGIA